MPRKWKKNMPPETVTLRDWTRGMHYDQEWGKITPHAPAHTHTHTHNTTHTHSSSSSSSLPHTSTNLHSGKDIFHVLILLHRHIARRCHWMHRFDHSEVGPTAEGISPPSRTESWAQVEDILDGGQSEAVRGILLITGGATSFSE